MKIATGKKTGLLHDLKYIEQGTDSSPGGGWVAISTTAMQKGYPASFLAPFRGGALGPSSKWIPLTRLEPEQGVAWSHDGSLLYFFSSRDSFPCIWGQRLNPVTKRPVGEPFAVHHFHRYQLYPSWLRTFAVTGDKLTVFLGSSASSVWMLEMHPSASGAAHLP